ncbi:MAG: twin-arginine translocase subunit TatC [Phycisphaeraceae bacterium]|nr:MAG: twin-arginine translocase subunit TatC [Phycisphaeraceae bacterium]
MADDARSKHDRREMSLGDHLEELRMRIILALVGVVPIFVVALAFGRPVLAFLIEPLRDQLRAASQPSGLLATGPLETFAVYFQISVIATVLIGSPWLIYQLWRFVAPGLYENERRFVHILVPLSTVLTISSAAFLYFAVLPVFLAFFIDFGSRLGESPTPTVDPPAGIVYPMAPVLDGDPPDPQAGQMWINRDTMQIRVAVPTRHGKMAIIGAELVAGAGITQQYRVSEYVKTVLNLALAFGVGFQTPVVVLLLGWAGLVDRAWLGKYRKHAIAVSAILGAVLTPADPLSMVLLAVPLYVLFELGMILLVIFPPGDRVNKKDGESQATKEPPVAADEDEPVANQPEPPALPGPSDDDE